MSYLLPQAVRHNYHVKKSEQGWDLMCLTCKQTFHLEKPKGPEDVQPLIQHTASHGVVEETKPPKRESKRPANSNSKPPTSAPSVSPSTPPEPPRVDNAYMVMVIPGKEPVATFIRLQHPLVSPTVDRHGKDGYVVLLHAANSRHATMVAERLVKDHKKRGVSGLYKAASTTLRPPRTPSKVPSKPPVG